MEAATTKLVGWHRKRNEQVVQKSYWVRLRVLNILVPIFLATPVPVSGTRTQHALSVGCSVASAILLLLLDC